MKNGFILTALLLCQLSTRAQQVTTPASPDHASPTAIVGALYSVISGPAGEARDWNRFKGLFAPTAKLFAVAKRPDGSFAHVPMSPDDYIARSGKSLVENGFVEREMNFEQEQFDNIVHRWSAYEGRVTAKPETAPIRGINSIQLISDGKRWFILSVLWEAESGELKLPKKLVKKLK